MRNHKLWKKEYEKQPITNPAKIKEIGARCKECGAIVLMPCAKCASPKQTTREKQLATVIRLAPRYFAVAHEIREEAKSLKA